MADKTNLTPKEPNTADPSRKTDVGALWTDAPLSDPDEIGTEAFDEVPGTDDADASPSDTGAEDTSDDLAADAEPAAEKTEERAAKKKKKPAAGKKKKAGKKAAGKKAAAEKKKKKKPGRVARSLHYAASTILANIKAAFARLLKNMQRNRRVFATVVLLAILFAGVITGLTAVYIIHKSDDLPMPMRYSNETMAYRSTTEAALETDKAFTYRICTGKDDVGNENINLMEGESGALFNLEEREILFSRNMYDRIYPASIT